MNDRGEVDCSGPVARKSTMSGSDHHNGMDFPMLDGVRAAASCGAVTGMCAP
jgi:hypothetical protein